MKRAHIEEYLDGRGLITRHCDEILAAIREHAEFLPRAEAEENPDYKQVIPYVAVTRADAVFAAKRLRAGGEARLHGLLSIGFGGHINPGDSGEDPLFQGLLRELREEVMIEDPGAPRFRGVINDDTNEVGRVHLGLFFTVEAGGEARVLEMEKLEGLWLAAADLPSYSDRMETWSRFAARALFEEVPA